MGNRQCHHQLKNEISISSSFEQTEEEKIKDILKLSPEQRIKNTVDLILRVYQITRKELAGRKPNNKITTIKSL